MRTSFVTYIGLLMLSLLAVDGYSQQAGETISPDQFESMSKRSDVQLVDVRTAAEFKKGFIEGSSNIDFNGNGFKRGVANLDPGKTVLVYCLSGGRSAKAAEYMRRQGLTVYELKGGILQWNKSKKPLVGGASSNALTSEKFVRSLSEEKLVLVDFFAPWCGPCKVMAPELEKIQKQHQNKVVLLKINADDNRRLMDSLQVDVLPTLLLYKNGKEVWKSTGLTSGDEIEKVLSRF